MKKGDIWISAALYFGLGIVVLSLILAAGLPVINKLRDKNIIIQTKEIMFKLLYFLQSRPANTMIFLIAS